MQAVAVLLLAALPAAAQSPNQNWETVKSFTTGTELRIAIGFRFIRGDFVRATDDTMVVASRKGQETFTRQEVAGVSIRESGHRGRNTLIGLGVGAGVGVVIGAAADAGCSYLCFGKPVLGVLGAIGGTIVGAVWPTGGWREVYRK